MAKSRQYFFLFLIIACGLSQCHAGDAEQEHWVVESEYMAEQEDIMVAEHWPEFEALIKQMAEDHAQKELLRQHLDRFSQNSEAASVPEPFDCVPYPSGEPPTSAHNLRPADIKVVGALGDSITAGNGILARLITGVSIENRGYSWSVGGESSIANGSYTLPNLLKLYNSEVTGYSTGNGNINSANAHLNAAIPGAVAPGMPYQAELLVERMKAYPGIDYDNDWKMVTLFIGGNDLCAYCNNRVRYSVENYTRNIQTALDTFHAEMPRAFINVASIFDVTPVAEFAVLSRPACLVFLNQVCSCAMNEDSAAEIRQISRQYSDSVEAMIASGRYDDKEDFTVVYQPFFRDNDLPRLEDGSADSSYFAPDCFHFNKVGHESVFRMLWNGLFYPVGEKPTISEFELPLNCPLEDEVFATNLNSVTQAPDVSTQSTAPVSTPSTTTLGPADTAATASTTWWILLASLCITGIHLY